MSKKATTNPFMLFLTDFREEQKRKGIVYSNISEAIKAADPLWRDCPISKRSKYEAKAKSQREKTGNKKFTSTGIPISMIEDAEQELKEYEQNEKLDIKALVNSSLCDNILHTLDIYLMDVNCYCLAVNDYIVGEFTLLRFNIEDGIKDTYHEMINPGNIPMGYSYQVKMGAKEFGLDMPDYDAPSSNYMQILANIVDYLKQQDHGTTVLPPIFTMPDKVIPIQNFIHQMCRRADEDESLFRIYKLDTLFYTLINALKTQKDEGFPKESLATQQLKNDPFKFSPGIACKHHEEIDKDVECCMSRAKRWTYTVLDRCCPVAGLAMKPGNHLPGDFDLQSIEIYNETKRERAGPSVAGFLRASSCSSITNDQSSVCSVNTSVTFDSAKTEKRKHEPLRMPKMDYSKTITRAAAPMLDESEFPGLGASMSGRGRGSTNRFKK